MLCGARSPKKYPGSTLTENIPKAMVSESDDEFTFCCEQGAQQTLEDTNVLFILNGGARRMCTQIDLPFALRIGLGAYSWEGVC